MKHKLNFSKKVNNQFRNKILITGVSLFVILSVLLVSPFLNQKTMIGKSGDQKFILKNESLIKDILWQHFDEKKEKIKSIEILDQTIKGEFDNGGDVGGDYDVTFQATVNEDKNKVMTVDINFPNAQIGPFTFIRPNPYKKKMDMTISKEHFHITVEDKVAKTKMDSWWNFAPEVWAENFSLESFDENSASHQTVEEIYATHRQSILDYVAKINNVSSNDIVEEDVKDLRVTNSSSNQFELDVRYLDKTNLSKTIYLHFVLSKENLSDLYLPIQGKVDKETEMLPFVAQKDIDVAEKMKSMQEEVDFYRELKVKQVAELQQKNEAAEKEIFEKYKEKCQELVLKKMTSGEMSKYKEQIEPRFKNVAYQNIYNFSIYYEEYFISSNRSLDSVYEVRVKLNEENLHNTNLPIAVEVVTQYNNKNGKNIDIVLETTILE
ncbi:hypothetical protein FACS1894193_13170 [Bacilli bacterium]|nr:hypothetical protein FACS1894193_13170 [Bacilli bacterium]